ncbi:MAG: hypothetical protein ACYTER_00350 [Planctomycetota bacterium]|jgi:hypothetical protein
MAKNKENPNFPAAINRASWYNTPGQKKAGKEKEGGHVSQQLSDTSNQFVLFIYCPNSCFLSTACCLLAIAFFEQTNPISNHQNCCKQFNHNCLLLTGD